MNYAEFEAMPAEDLRCLSVRARNCIINELGYEASIGDIIAISDKDLLRVPNFGKKSLSELRSTIEEMASRHGICISDFKGVQRRLPLTAGPQAPVDRQLKALHQANHLRQQRACVGRAARWNCESQQYSG